MEKFAVGVVLGTLCGALLVTNNYKMRTLVKKGQAEIAEKLDKLMDEKIEEVEEQTEKIKEEVQEKKDELVEKVKNKKSSKK
jgi:uncharacterized membrane protein